MPITSAHPLTGQWPVRLLPLVVLFWCLLPVTAGSQEVTIDEARSVAGSFLALHTGSQGHWNQFRAPEVGTVTPVVDRDGLVLAYAVEVRPTGHILVPASRLLPPVKGYSTRAPFTPDNGPGAWVTAQLQQVKDAGLLTDTPRRDGVRIDALTNAQAWTALLTDTGTERSTGDAVVRFRKRGPLLSWDASDVRVHAPADQARYNGTIQWGQTAPFNAALPEVAQSPEEVWMDLDGDFNGTLESPYELVFDPDGEFRSEFGTVGQPAGLHYHDADGLGQYRLYTTEPLRLALGYVNFTSTWGEGYDVWRDEAGGVSGQYDEGIDTPIFDGGDVWTTPDGAGGSHAGLYYTDADGDRAYTSWKGAPVLGSAPVALAQVMRWWEWPESGLGTHSYDWAYHEDGEDEQQTVTLSADFEHAYAWNRMPLRAFAFATTAERNEVARLLADVGIALETDFQLSEPLGSLESHLERFAYHLRYNRDGLSLLKRTNADSDEEWFQWLRQELDQHRPLVLGAHRDDDKWHALVVDGYDMLAGTANLYLLHCNMGLGSGTDTGAYDPADDPYWYAKAEWTTYDYWFALDNILGNPGGYDPFTNVPAQEAVVNILPTAARSVVAVEMLRVTDGTTAQVQAGSDALQAMVNLYGATRLVPLVYASEGDPLAPIDPETLAFVQERAALLGSGPAPEPDPVTAPAVFMVQGRAQDAFAATSATGTTAALLQQRVEQRRQTPSGYRLAGDCVLAPAGIASPTGLPYLSCDALVTAHHEDTDQQAELELCLLLVEPAVAHAGRDHNWVVRRLLTREPVRPASAETVHVSVESMSPAHFVDLLSCHVAALLLDDQGNVLQSALLDRRVYGDLELENSPPQAPTQVTVTAERTAGSVTALSAEAVGAADPDGDRLTYLYRWRRVWVGSGPDPWPPAPVLPANATVTAADVGGRFYDGEVWWCEVRVRDAFYDSVDMNQLLTLKADNPYLGSPFEDLVAPHETEAVVSNLLVIAEQGPEGNRPPTAPVSVRIDPETPAVDADLVCYASGAADPDGDALGLVYTWQVDRGVGWQDTAYSEARLPAGATLEDEHWRCRVAARDVWGLVSADAESGPVTIVPAPAPGTRPTPPLYARVSPADPSYINDLACSLPTGIECDDPVEIVFHWWHRTALSWEPTAYVYRLDPDGTLLIWTPETQDWAAVEGDRVEVPAADTVVQEAWRCEIYAVNAVTHARSRVYVTPEVLVRNKPPLAPSVTIFPSVADADTPLRCRAEGAVDPENPQIPVEVYYEWFVDGERSGWRERILPAEATSSGELWTCRVYAQDSLGARSTTVETEPARIGSRPTLPTVQISPTRPQEDDDLFCLATGSSDPDGDVVQYVYTWYVDGRPAGQNGPVVPRTYTMYAERWYCVVRATDGGLATDPVVSETVMIGNQRPQQPQLAISPPSPKPGQAITCEITNNPTDPEGDYPLTTVFSWYLEGGESDEGTSTYSTPTLPVNVTKANQTWKCQVYIQDNPPPGIREARSPTTTVQVSFVSMPPTAPERVWIEPDAPKAGEDLVAYATGSVDPNGDPFTYGFEWFRRRDGVDEPVMEAGIENGTVPAALTRDGDLWYCFAFARDTYEKEGPSVQSNTVSVGNVPPTAPAEVRISPDPAGALEDLVCTALGSVDANGDRVIYEYRWWRNDDLYRDWSEDGYRIAATELVLGDRWLCEVRALDGEAVPPESGVLSNQVQIRDLAPTGPETVTVLPAAPTTVHDLVCSAVGASDPEGGAVTFEYLWYRNGTATDITSPRVSVDSVPTAIGETWACRVRAVDLLGNAGAYVTSGAVTVRSPAPTAPHVEVQPADASSLDELHCTVSGSEDPLGGSLTFHYHWFLRRDGADWIESGHNTAALPAEATRNLDVWRCAVYAQSDSGFRSPTVTSNEVSVANHTPTPPASVKVTPNVAATDGQLVCYPAGSVDVDGDPVSYTYVWQTYAGNLEWVDTGIREDRVNPPLAEGTTWRCLVAATDGELTSRQVVSNLARVALETPEGPAPPDAVVVLGLDPDLGAPAAGEEVLCVPTGGADFFAYRFQWRRDGIPVPEFTSAVVPSGTTNAGEEWSCEVRTLDTEDRVSTAVTAAVVVVPERGDPPSRPVHVGVSPQVPSYTDTVLASRPTGAELPDDGGEPVFVYRWEHVVGDDWVPTTETGTELPLSPAEIGSRWRVRVAGVNPDTGAAGPSLEGTEVLVVNFAPSEPSVSLSAQFATPADSVTCFASGAGDREDGSAVAYVFEWLVNGNPSGVRAVDTHQHTIEGHYFSAGDVWTCRVTAFDSYGAESAPVLSPNSVFIGSPPSPATRAVISPARPEPYDDISCAASGAEDPDGEAVSYVYHWYLETDLPPGVQVVDQLAVLPTPRPGRYWEQVHEGQLLASAMTGFGERWTCVVYATDGTLVSAPIAGKPVTVGNQPPTRPDLLLEPANPGLADDVTCRILNQISDPEGDSFTTVFRWYRTDTDDTTPYVGNPLPATLTAAGQAWICEVTVQDQWTPAAANVVQSDTLYFRAVAPSPPTQVIVQPAAPQVEQSLTCVASGAVDPNGDPIHYVYLWEQNGVEQADLDSDTVPAVLTAVDDQWRCRVAAVDSGGLSSDPVWSQAVTIGNRPPGAPTNVTISPDPAGVGADLVCTASGAVDPNGDPVSYLFQWYLNGTPVAGAEDYRISSDELALGQTWTCRARATDGTETGPETVSNAVTIRDLPPEAPTLVTILPADPTMLDDLVCSAGGAVDPEGDAVSYRYQWYRNGLATEYQAQVLPARATAIGEEWSCTVRAADTSGQLSEVAASEVVRIATPAPDTPVIRIEPAVPSVSDALECVVTDADPDLAYTFAWYRNGNPTPHSTATVPPGDTSTGDTWKCVVYAATDLGYRSPAVTSNEVWIDNRAPTLKAAVIQPAAPRTTHELVCTVSGVTDPEGHAVTVRYEWYRDGALAGVSTPNVDPALTANGEVWTCQVTPVDAYGAVGIAHETAPVTVQDLPPAPPDSVVISPDAPGVGGILTCEVRPVEPYDPNGDPAHYRYRWEYRNPGSVTWTASGHTGPQVADLTVDGRSWRCTVRAAQDDGALESSPVTSNPVQVVGSAPTPPTTVSLTPEYPGVHDELVCTAGGSVDPDGDAVVYVFSWIRNGVPSGVVTEHPRESRLDAALTGHGEYWSCEVRARDSQLVYSTAVTSADVVVLNQPPSPPTSVTLLPETPTTNNPIQCLASGAVDPDGGQVGYVYEWYVNGAVAPDYSGAVLPASATAATSPPQRWTCKVYARDDTGALGEGRTGNSVLVYPSGTDPYENDDEPESASTIANGERQVHELTADDEDWVLFELERRRDVRVICDLQVGEEELRLELYDQNGILLGRDPWILHRILPEGVYLIRALLPAADATSVIYGLELDHAQPTCLGTAPGEDVTGLVSAASPRLWTCIAVPNPATVGITPTLDPPGTAFTLTLYGSDGLVLAEVADAPLTGVRVPESGLCTVVLTAHEPSELEPVQVNLALSADTPVRANHAPNPPTLVKVVPETANAFTELFALAGGAVDPDASRAAAALEPRDPRQSITYRYRWRNDQGEGFAGDTLAAALAADGTTWTCEVMVADGYGFGSDWVATEPVTIGSRPEWTLALTVSGADTAELAIGQARNATSGWDEGLDDTAPPSAPDLAHVTIQGPFGYEQLTRDIRAGDAGTVHWYVQATGTDGVTLAWDPEDLPAEGSMTLVEVAGNGQLLTNTAVDMRQTRELDLRTAARPAPVYRLTYQTRALEFETVTLNAGWNMVSFHLQGEYDALDLVFQERISGSVWTFDPLTGHYDHPDKVEPLTGLWVFTPYPVDIRHVGRPAPSGATVLWPGWNLVGPIADTPPPADPRLNPNSIWYWDGEGYVLSSWLRRNRAYWILATDVVDTILGSTTE
jgi:hypothetical protein